jgi:thiamine biosynthesis lipoprotein ApbE
MEADALSTGIMVLGPVEGFQLMKRLEDTEGMIVTKGGESMTTPGLDNLAV